MCTRQTNGRTASASAYDIYAAFSFHSFEGHRNNGPPPIGKCLRGEQASARARRGWDGGQSIMVGVLGAVCSPREPHRGHEKACRATSFSLSLHELYTPFCSFDDASGALEEEVVRGLRQWLRPGRGCLLGSPAVSRSCCQKVKPQRLVRLQWLGTFFSTSYLPAWGAAVGSVLHLCNMFCIYHCRRHPAFSRMSN